MKSDETDISEYLFRKKYDQPGKQEQTAFRNPLMRT